nr:immunoglobulin light chain junction region [Macaca mulatta]MOW67471.1 immunoglobulin light chain junction region [Macaca mulatta]MOW69331.1 immunoglobulin light chain junction region [Macaca mulatta]MOW69565.1 immunoglobulin light chain junction region [Macaca mulatta]MOW70172.1 immunoglobulin light chain junction region [Macaca mulatta]
DYFCYSYSTSGSYIF